MKNEVFNTHTILSCNTTKPQYQSKPQNVYKQTRAMPSNQEPRLLQYCWAGRTGPGRAASSKRLGSGQLPGANRARRVLTPLFAQNYRVAKN